jgi:hypothetical protein
MSQMLLSHQESIRWHCWSPATAAIIVEKCTRKLCVWYPSKPSSNKGDIQPSRPCGDHQGRRAVWPLVGDLVDEKQIDPFFGFAKSTSEAGIHQNGDPRRGLKERNNERGCNQLRSSIDDGAGLLFE